MRQREILLALLEEVGVKQARPFQAEIRNQSWLRQDGLLTFKIG